MSQPIFKSPPSRLMPVKLKRLNELLKNSEANTACIFPRKEHRVLLQIKKHNNYVQPSKHKRLVSCNLPIRNQPSKGPSREKQQPRVRLLSLRTDLPPLIPEITQETVRLPLIKDEDFGALSSKIKTKKHSRESVWELTGWEDSEHNML